MKRVVVISDLHCGHRSGLTPPAWQTRGGKYGVVQRKLWDFYSSGMMALAPIHTLVVNGDCVDGKGEKSGGNEQITTDRAEQSAMATACLKQAGAQHTLMTFGTPYHVGTDECWERVVADAVGAEKITDHLWFKVDGTTFDVKHHVAGSAVPYSRFTSMARARLWENIWAHEERREPADILVRSHVHYFAYAGDARSLQMITPALQGYSRYGVNRCEGLIQVGFVWFDVEKDGYTWGRDILESSVFKSDYLAL